ncbi:VOC family protein [Arsenicicoccus sp. oral taxon 190]|uniref:VOC family protein n=1 Tax=Arsenicicoccus sp. oral taxon 190 TaxID=1658671 RepID=UPI00067A0BD8|nr:VOC family protein [Arsenicicoccus sp. oral taxon 190]AKT50605.1 hypothetical protein ADJ73_03505 [Arsenicicoccus sp. oral taxon 190]
MPIRDTTWPEGTPCWPDLMCDDPRAAARFYGQVFGWEVEEGPDGYLLMLRDGKRVAGIGPKPPAAPWPAVWTTYLAVTDIHRSVGHAKAEGAQQLLPPTPVPGLAQIALVVTPTGEHVGLWQAEPAIGTERYNEHHAPVWNELMTRDPQEAMGFYSEVLGYSYEEFTEDDGELAYATMVTVDGRPVAGLGLIGPEYDDSFRPHWMTYVCTDVPAATVSAARRLGADVLMDVVSGPFGEQAVLRGPQGEVFSVIRPDHLDE